MVPKCIPSIRQCEAMTRRNQAVLEQQKRVKTHIATLTDISSHASFLLDMLWSKLESILDLATEGNGHMIRPLFAKARKITS